MTGQLPQLASLGYSDTGPVQGSNDYTTIVMIHGYGFHGSLFQHTQTFSAKHNARFVAINRRDYPGSKPLSTAERSLLHDAEKAPNTKARELLFGYMRDRAKEIFDFLVAFVARESLPKAHNATGGIVLCSWSFANTYMTSLLANVASFSSSEVDLTKFIRRVVLFDPPYHSLGYPPPPDPYHPLYDESIPPSDRARVFAAWVSGYYTHDMATGHLERRVPDADVRPTLEQLTPEQTQACFSADVASPGGSDFMMLDLGIKTGLNDDMRAKALALPDGLGDSAWADIPLRYLWCSRSGYEIPWGMKCLSKEVNEAKASHRRLRPISIVCLPGANHFYHWDNPERCLMAFLDQDSESA